MITTLQIRNTIKYRPINTIRACEKIIEKIVKSQLEEDIFRNITYYRNTSQILERSIHVRRQLPVQSIDGNL